MDAKIHAALVAATAVLLSILSADALAQSTRSYQMTVYPNVDATSAGMDIPMFTKGVFTEQAQPPGRSIFWVHPDTQPAQLDQYGIDWSRIAALYVDEPYYQFVKPGNFTNCTPPGQHQRRTNIVNLANALRARAPSARFWVNFNDAEIYMIVNRGCSFNESYIDVISMDYYYVDFDPYVRPQYEYIYAHRPTSYQQLALVVPVFMQGTPPSGRFAQTAMEGVTRLTAYLAYAAEKNQTCNLPLGLTGITRIYDGCPVWAVAGFVGGMTQPGDDSSLLPLDSPISVHIKNKWQEKFAVQRIDPTQVRRWRALAPTLFSE